MGPFAGAQEAVIYFMPRAPRTDPEFYSSSRYGEMWVGQRESLEEMSAMAALPTAPIGSLAEAVGRPFRFEEVSPEVAREDYLTRGMPAQAVDSMQTHFDAAVDGILRYLARSVGRPAEVTSAVPDVTGRPARTFAEWAAEHAAAFRA